MTIYNRNNYILSDSPLKNDLLKLFNKNDKLIILDIGGCEGEESIRYSRIFPEAFIYIFEPLPNNQKLISENIAKYNARNIELIPFAVSDENGFSQFHVSSGHPNDESEDLDWDFGNKSSSILSPQLDNINSWLNFNKIIEIPTVTLSTFLFKNKIAEVDFIHMDVQGAELKVLIGAKKNIKKVKAIWLEVADIEIYKNQPLRIDIEKFMKINNFYLVKSYMQKGFGDQLYLNKYYYYVFSFFSIFIVKKIRIFQQIHSFFRFNKNP